MEVCGGQTHTIVKYGIDRLLPPEVELVHGPGCPVCVTSLEQGGALVKRDRTGQPGTREPPSSRVGMDRGVLDGVEMAIGWQPARDPDPRVAEEGADLEHPPGSDHPAQQLE